METFIWSGNYCAKTCFFVEVRTVRFGTTAVDCAEVFFALFRQLGRRIDATERDDIRRLTGRTLDVRHPVVPGLKSLHRLHCQ